MFATIAAEAARRFGSRPAVIGPDGVLSYGDLDRSARRLAATLRTRGVRLGDVVALTLPSGGDWLVAAVAANRVGAIVAGVSTALSTPERSELLELIHPRVVAAGPDSVDGAPLRSDVVVIEPGSRGAQLGDVVEPVDPGSDGPTVGGDPDDRPVAICFTSGTTGRPKAALFLNRQLRAIETIDRGPNAATSWSGGADMLASTQFAHVGMTTKFPWYLRSGSTLHVMDRWRADDALRLVAEHRMPTIGAVAPQLALMLRSPLLDELDLSSVRLIVAGGAPSPPALVDEARRRLRAGYSIRWSSTESGGVGLATTPDAPDHEALHTVGRPRPGVEVRIADDADRPVGDGQVGELQLRSAAVMDGYWGDATATAGALTPDGWLRTGDLASIDDTGCVTLAGRRSDMYIRGGYNVFPTEVEAVLVEDPTVRDVVVVAVPDPVLGEVGVALVVPADPDDPPDLSGVRARAGERLAHYKLPDRLETIDAVPLTAAQKTDRAAARTLLATPAPDDTADRAP